MARLLITVVLLWCAGAAVPTSATEEFGMDAFIRGPNKHAMHTALDTMIVGPLATLLTGLARAHGPDDWQARVHGLANADRDTVSSFIRTSTTVKLTLHGVSRSSTTSHRHPTPLTPPPPFHPLFPRWPSTTRTPAPSCNRGAPHDRRTRPRAEERHAASGCGPAPRLLPARLVESRWQQEGRDVFGQDRRRGGRRRRGRRRAVGVGRNFFIGRFVGWRKCCTTGPSPLPNLASASVEPRSNHHSFTTVLCPSHADRALLPPHRKCLAPNAFADSQLRPLAHLSRSTRCRATPSALVPLAGQGRQRQCLRGVR